MWGLIGTRELIIIIVYKSRTKCISHNWQRRGYYTRLLTRICPKDRSCEKKKNILNNKVYSLKYYIVDGVLYGALSRRTNISCMIRPVCDRVHLGIFVVFVAILTRPSVRLGHRTTKTNTTTTTVGAPQRTSLYNNTIYPPLPSRFNNTYYYYYYTPHRNNGNMTFQHVVIIMVTIVNRRRATKDCGRADRTSTEQQQYDVNRSRPKKEETMMNLFRVVFVFGFLRRLERRTGERCHRMTRTYILFTIRRTSWRESWRLHYY